MAKIKVIKKVKTKKPIKLTKDLPATMGVIFELRKVMEAKFRSQDKKFVSIDKRFEAIDKRFEAIDKRFEALENKMDSRFDDLKSDMHRMLILMEEQNNRNKFVLDGYTGLYERMDRLEVNVETRLKNIESVILMSKAEA